MRMYAIQLIKKYLYFTLFTLLFCTYPTFAEVHLPKIFGDNMVLQRGTQVPVWGTAKPGENISLSIQEQRPITTADEKGAWRITLAPLEAGGPFTMTISGNNTITFKNILAGEVWICSGQSNMECPVKRTANAESETANENNPSIRLFSIPWILAEKPMDELYPGNLSSFYKAAAAISLCDHRLGSTVEWTACTPQTVSDFSGIGYFFGKEIQSHCGVPVGIIQATWDGSSITGWMSLASLMSHREFNPILDLWGRAFLDYPSAKAEHEKRLMEWEKAKQKAEAVGQPVPAIPWIPRGPEHHHRPGGMFNGMIAPLIPFGMRGVIWYQGEADAGGAYLYRLLFRTLIQNWRESWRQGDFPFLFAQLANFRSNVHLYKRAPAEPVEPADDYWAELREAQTMALTLPNTGMAVTIDIGEPDNIHPKNKREVGRRFALAAGKVAYGENIEFSGPMYKSMAIGKSVIRLMFDHVGGGLIAKGGERLKGFAVAGADRKFVWAEARIEGNQVIVWSEKVTEPVAVRYAWASYPDCNLYNAEGLPASPFRTDSWPGITEGR